MKQQYNMYMYKVVKLLGVLLYVIILTVFKGQQKTVKDIGSDTQEGERQLKDVGSDTQEGERQSKDAGSGTQEGVHI